MQLSARGGARGLHAEGGGDTLLTQGGRTWLALEERGGAQISAGWGHAACSRAECQYFGGSSSSSSSSSS